MSKIERGRVESRKNEEREKYQCVDKINGVNGAGGGPVVGQW